MNTVKQAQQVFCQLEKLFVGDLMLFHAQFPAGRRKEIEEDCIRKFGKNKSQRPGKGILVATQVVEQSLDVDFDAMMTAAAPVDLLLQRMGRIFRHGETKRPLHMQQPMQWILTPKDSDFGVDAYVYPEVLLQQSVRILSARETVNIPEDIASLVADGYDATKVPEHETEKWLEHIVGEQVKAGQSRKYLIGCPNTEYSALNANDYLFDDGENGYLSVQTRLGEPSIRIALLEAELYRQIEQLTNKNGVASVRDRVLARAVQEQSVSVAARRLHFDESCLSYIKGDMLLKGIRIYPASDGCCQLPDGRIVFDKKLGVIIEEGEK